MESFAGKIQTKLINIDPFGIRFNSGDEFKYSLVNRFENLTEDFYIYSDYVIPMNDYPDVTLYNLGQYDSKNRICRTSNTVQVDNKARKRNSFGLEFFLFETY